MYPVLLMKLLCFALFACAFNLLLGYTGLLSFGHAAFFGAAGYVTGYAIQTLELPFELGIVLGVAAAALIGLVMGLLAVRRQGIYFTMITLALAQMFYFVCVQAPQTHGEDGMQGVARGKLLGMLDLSNDLAMYYVVLALAVGGFALIARVVHSPFGQVLKAIKENEPRAISLGYDVDKYKLMAFVLSASLGRFGRRDQDHGARLGVADRCGVDDVGPGGVDDPGGRFRHAGRPDSRRDLGDRPGKPARRYRRSAGQRNRRRMVPHARRFGVDCDWLYLCYLRVAV